MIVTIEGYNSKKNKSVRLASELAAFSAIKNGDKTLVINLINPDIDTAERMLAGVGMEERLQTEYQNNISDDGIDSLLRQAETKMLNEEDFDKYVLPMFHIKNRLDVATVTKNKSFTDLLKSEARFLALKRVILSAKDIYENIILLLDSKEDEVANMIKSLDEVDKNIVCLKQGFTKHEEVTGKDIIYVVTDYNSKSKFNLKMIEREFISKSILGKKSEPLLKISENIYAEDAAHSGTIIQFVGRNKEANPEDINYEWISDELALMNLVFNNKRAEIKEQEFEKQDPAERKRSFKLFGRKKVEKIDNTQVEELPPYEPEFDEYEVEEEIENVAVLADIEDDDDYIEKVEVEDEDILPPLNEPPKKKGFGLFGKKKHNEVAEEEPAEEVHQESLEEENARLLKEIEKLKANQNDVKPKTSEAPKKKGPKPITVNGVEYSSLRVACDAYDLGYNDVKAKLQAHMTISEAFGLK